MEEIKVPRQYSLCRFDFDSFPKDFDVDRAYPFKREHSYIYLGEIPNMPGHCVVVGHDDGRIYSGYHNVSYADIRNFRLATERERFLYYTYGQKVLIEIGG